MIKVFDASLDAETGKLILTGELRPEGLKPLIPTDSPFQLMRYKVVRKPDGSVAFTFYVEFIGANFERELMAEKKAIRRD